jgi:hypothetical protein
MEIEKTAVTSMSDAPKVGDLLRVRVLKRLADRSFLVEIRGSAHRARLTGSIPTPLFIGRVQRLSPYVLKFVRSLGAGPEAKGLREGGGAGSGGTSFELEAVLQRKKSIIRPLFTTDNFPEGVPFFEIKDRKEIKRSLKRFIRRYSRSFSTTAEKRVSDYLILQNLSNLLSSQTYSLLLPVMFRNKRSLLDLKMLGGNESQEKGFMLHVHSGDETKITFVVFIDYEVIRCSVSANDPAVEDLIRDRLTLLEGGLKSSYYNRSVEVRVVPFDETGENNLAALRRIDVRM